MNWEAIGAVGEILGAIGVIASLFYVAYQVHQNTKQSDLNTSALEASSEEAAIAMANSIRWKIAESREVAEIYFSGLQTPDSLDEIDLVRFRLIMSSQIEVIALTHAQIILGRRPNAQWNRIVPFVKRMITTPGGKWFWQNHSGDFSNEFQKYVEMEIEESSALQTDQKL